MKVTLVAGLPGSGKTTLLKEMKSQGAVTVDDIADLDSLPASPVPWLVVADVNFCIPEVRDRAGVEIRKRYGHVDIEWVFFANDREQCLRNAEARNDGRNVRPDIEVLSRRYVIPNGALVRSVFGATAETERRYALVEAVEKWHEGYEKDDAWTGGNLGEQERILALAKGIEVSYDGMLYRGTAILDDDFLRLQNGEEVSFRLKPAGHLVSWSKALDVADTFAKDAWNGGEGMCAIVIALSSSELDLVVDLGEVSDDAAGEDEVISRNREIKLTSRNVVRMYAYEDLMSAPSGIGI